MAEVDIEELLEENRKLKEMLGFNADIAFNSPIDSKFKGDASMIRGVAITQGEWNGAYYPKDLLRKIAKEGHQLPIKVEHKKNPYFKDRTVGHIKKWEYNPTILGIIYQAVIEDQYARELIKQGKLKGVSIAGAIKTRREDGINLVTDLELQEMSLVENPAVDCAIVAYNRKECNHCSLKDLLSKINKENVELKGGSVSMTEETKGTEQEVEEIEELEEEDFELPPVIVEEKERLEEGEEGETEAARRRRKRYYYYPYPYYPYYYICYPYGKKRTRKLSEVLADIDANKQAIEDILKRIEELQKYKCPSCGRTFNQWADFFGHWMKEHGEEYGPYKKAKQSEESSEESSTEETMLEEKKEEVAKEEGKQEAESTEEVAKEESKEEVKEEESKEEAPVEEKETKEEESKEEVSKEKETKEEEKAEEKEEEKATEEEVPKEESEETKEINIEDLTAGDVLVAQYKEGIGG